MTTPIIVYGTDCSYYTGKIEAYLKAKGIAYRLEPFTPANMRRCAAHTGITQIPQLELSDGSWLIDTTLIMQHYEEALPDRPALRPSDPAASFIADLIEDFADEWLWRPAMHYRWSFAGSARLMSGWLAEHLTAMPGPQFLKRAYWYRRQLGVFVRGDGVTPANRTGVEAAYLDSLRALEAVFAERPYVMGTRPCQADFGFMAPMFRHFLCDPVPGRVMRNDAPGVHEWAARMWNLSPVKVAAMTPVTELPRHLEPLLALIARDYLPYLEANARAFAAGDKMVASHIGGAPITEPVKPYRVWCRDRLHTAFMALTPEDRERVTALCPPGALMQLAKASSKPVASLIPALPIKGRVAAKTADSWWRQG
ncbi:MAG TPA: glutathione S-transferase family protein [Alphaproteobacteria bacterium]|nr:glutathione S-transferase family protein [Alphaproteobacteria bacterium]